MEEDEAITEMSLLIKNGTIVIPDGTIQGDILVENDLIKAVDERIENTNAEIIDAQGMIV